MHTSGREDGTVETIALKDTETWRGRGVMDVSGLAPIVAGLCQALRSWHGGGRIHGRVSPSSVRVDVHGAVYLDPPEQQQAGDNPPLYGVLADGYAAFEQYMDEDAWPLGPWTDVHGVSALAYEMITGRVSQDAVKRMAGRAQVQFAPELRERFPDKLLSAIERGLSISAQSRQQSLDEFLLSAGLPPPSEELRQSDAEPRLKSKKPVGWLMPLAVLLLLGTGAAIWASQHDKPGETPVVVASDVSSASGSTGMTQEPETAETLQAPERPETSQVSETSQVPRTSEIPGTSEIPETSETPAVLWDSIAGGAPEAADSVAAAIAVDGSTADSPGAARENALADSASSPDGASLAEPPASADNALPTDASASAVDVKVDVQPWGEIFVDGRLHGISPPLRALSLSPGSYQIRVQNGDLPPAQIQLTIQEGEAAVIRHVFGASDF